MIRPSGYNHKGSKIEAYAHIYHFKIFDGTIDKTVIPEGNIV